MFWVITVGDEGYSWHGLGRGHGCCQAYRHSQSLSHVRLCNTMDSPRLLCLWDFPGKNTGADYHFLLQMLGILHQIGQTSTTKNVSSATLRNSVLDYKVIFDGRADGLFAFITCT